MIFKYLSDKQINVFLYPQPAYPWRAGGELISAGKFKSAITQYQWVHLTFIFLPLFLEKLAPWLTLLTTCLLIQQCLESRPWLQERYCESVANCPKLLGEVTSGSYRGTRAMNPGRELRVGNRAGTIRMGVRDPLGEADVPRASK